MSTIPLNPVLANASSTGGFRCNVCDRDFVNEAALQMHFQNSEFHKKETRRQTTSTQTKKFEAIFVPISSNVASSADQSMTNIPKATFKHGNNHWTMIPPMQQLSSLEALAKLCHLPEELLKSKYLVEPYGTDEISLLRRCKNCNGEFQKIRLVWRSCLNCWRLTENSSISGSNGLPVSSAKADYQGEFGDLLPVIIVLMTRPSQNPSGGPKIYVCCGKTAPGCTSLPAHDYWEPDPLLAAYYQEFSRTPTAFPLVSPKRRAVTIDCEMAGVVGENGVNTRMHQ